MSSPTNPILCSFYALLTTPCPKPAKRFFFFTPRSNFAGFAVVRHLCCQEHFVEIIEKEDKEVVILTRIYTWQEISFDVFLTYDLITV